MGDLNLFDPVGWALTATFYGKPQTTAHGHVLGHIPSAVNRMLSEENVTETGDATTDAIVNGIVAIGNLLAKDTNEIQANFLNIHVDGLPADCTDCFMKVAISQN